MTDPFLFELVSPEKLVLSEDVNMVVVPGTEGDFGVLIGHSHFIASLRPGVIDVYNGDKIEKQVFIAGGFSEVMSSGCTVIAEETAFLNELDRTVVEKRIEVANNALSEAKSENAIKTAIIELDVATAMLKAITKDS